MVITQKKSLVFIMLILVLSALTGCATISALVESKTAADKNVQTPVAPPAEPIYASLSPSEGSLWTDSGDLLYLDRRARRIGDTVTVDIVENTSSSMDANTKATRSSSMDAGISNLLGYMRHLEKAYPNLNKDESGKYVNKLFGANMTSEFDGKGTSDRSGQVTASIGARVTEVLPNGNLVIRGKREMKVNNEVQYIIVSGVARPDDIGPDNRVKSTYLADSRIEYYGKGVLADKQKPGWLTQILDKVWPF